MGVRFPKNFNYPYISTSLGEFWTRWHITLSRWLRDYLYIPLGGNRKGKYRTYSNLMVTMLLGGLWHGASWTFVVWGAMHGAALAVERAIGGGRRSVLRPHSYFEEGRIVPHRALVRLMAMIVVFVFILVTWVFFRAPTFSLAIAVLHKMFIIPFREPFVWPAYMNRFLLLLIPIALLHAGQLMHEWFGLRKNAYVRATLAAGMMFALLVVQRQGEHVFIYFQF
jgi:alginate O-acetyltransferase complex protein AlgI